jgi:hypothetical protein
VLLALLICAGAHAQELEWTKWTGPDGVEHEYAVIMEPASWDTQQTIAEAENGYLVTILSSEEQTFVRGLIAQAEAVQPAETYWYWIGLVHPEGAPPKEEWGWVTAEPMSIVYWRFSEPSGDGNVGSIHKTSGLWYDGPARDANRAVIEREGPPPPTDTTPPDLSLSADPTELPQPARMIPVTVSGSVTDTESAIASATLTVVDEDGLLDDEIDLLGELEPDGSFSLTIELSSAVAAGDNDGRDYTISLNAADEAGNAADEISVTITAIADSTPPVTALTADPTELSWPARMIPVTVSGSVTDTESAIASATLTVVDEDGLLDDEIDLLGELEPDGSFSLTIELSSAVAAGDNDGRDYTISLNAADEAGNATDEISVTITAPPDTTPPSVALESPDPALLPSSQPRQLKMVIISGAAVDDQSGILTATVTVSDAYGAFDEVRDITGSIEEDGAFSVTFYLSSELSGGDDAREYEFTLVAVDNAGNESGEVSVVVRAERPGPGNNPGQGHGPGGNPGRGNGNGRNK